MTFDVSETAEPQSFDVLETSKPLTLGELHQALSTGEDAVKVGYSTLSEIVATGDIKEQLKVRTVSGRLEFSTDVVLILRQFWPVYKHLGGKRANAPDILRNFLASRSDVSETSKGMVRSAGFGVSETSNIAPLVAVLEKLVTRLEPPQDRLLTSDGAAVLLSCKPRSVGRYVRPVRPGRWRESDILRYIQGL
jgi:hypothetical protein